MTTTTEPRFASCGITWVDGTPTPGHAVVPSHPGLAFFSDESVNWPKLCAVCGKYEEPHLRVTSVARGAKRITDHVFVARQPLPFDTYYCGCRGWD